MLLSQGVPSPDTHTARAEETNSTSYANHRLAAHEERHPLKQRVNPGFLPSSVGSSTGELCGSAGVLLKLKCVPLCVM